MPDIGNRRQSCRLPILFTNSGMKWEPILNRFCFRSIMRLGFLFLLKNDMSIKIVYRRKSFLCLLRHLLLMRTAWSGIKIRQAVWRDVMTRSCSKLFLPNLSLAINIAIRINAYNVYHFFSLEDTISETQLKQAAWELSLEEAYTDCGDPYLLMNRDGAPYLAIPVFYDSQQQNPSKAAAMLYVNVL